ncbi:MAG: beta-eliminating lyase-related protein [bacterium]
MQQNCYIFSFRCAEAAYCGGKGIITVDQVAVVINPPQYYYLQSAEIVVESTHNSAGGTIFPLAQLARLYELAKLRNLKRHVEVTHQDIDKVLMMFKEILN